MFQLFLLLDPSKQRVGWGTTQILSVNYWNQFTVRIQFRDVMTSIAVEPTFVAFSLALAKISPWRRCIFLDFIENA